MHFEVLTVDADMTGEAVGISVLDQICSWDALAIAAAQKGKCAETWKEDLKTGQIFARSNRQCSHPRTNHAQAVALSSFQCLCPLHIK